MVTAACLVIDSEGAVTGALPAPPTPTLIGLLSVVGNPAQPATFFSAEAYRRAGGLDRRYDLAMDMDLWFKLARIGPIKTLPTELLARFRVHPMAKSSAAAAATARQDLRIRRRHGAPLRTPVAFVLFRAGYVRPIVSPWSRAVKGLVKRVLLGRQKPSPSPQPPTHDPSEG